MATPTQPSFIPEPWASQGSFDPIPDTQQTTGRASWADGFPVENSVPIAQGGIPPHYLDFQGVLNALSSFAWWQQRGGQFSWSADLEYPVGAFVLGSDGQLYKSIQASSPSDPQDPTTATAYWTIADPTAFLPLSGGTMTGTLTFDNGNDIGDYLPLSGGTMTGDLSASGGDFAIKKTINTGRLIILGGSGFADGSSFYLHGKSESGNPGIFECIAHNGTNSAALIGKPEGSLSWGGQDIHRNVDNNLLRLSGGGSASSGSHIVLNSASVNSGAFQIIAKNSGGTVKQLWGGSTGSLTWDGQPIQTSSDERLKTGFSNVPDDVLDAWGKVEWSQFKFKEDAERKGLENCRWHPGLVAQRVKAVFEEEGLDACAYGILCHDEWNDQYEDVEVVDVPETKDEEGKIVPAVTHTEHRLVREAGDLWTIRYEEALAMEAAYQRRRADRLEARLAAIEERLNALDGDLR